MSRRRLMILREKPRSLGVLLLTVGCGLTIGAARAQSEGNFDVEAHYEKHEYLIPMRDGVRLFTSVYVPKDRSQNYPFLMTRTPYSVRPYGADSYRRILGPHEGYAEEGFIFVFQDVRGAFMSEGEFAHVRPYIPNKSGPGEVDESTDTYDTVTWLLQNVSQNNGRVGIYGISYPGFYAAAGIIDSHPAIRAASPQAPIGDWFIGDDVHHHGAFYLLDSFTFFWSMGRARSTPTTQFPARFDFKTGDAYKFFLEMGPLPQADAKYMKGEVPFWNDLMEHGSYDEFWQRRNLIPRMNNVQAAVMTVGGWFDAEDLYGPLHLYQSIETRNPGISNTLVLGPWCHGCWVRSEGDRLGNVQFDGKASAYYEDRVDLPFFNFHLKDKGESKLPEALVFLTGANEWRSFDRWPPQHVERRSLYLRAGRGLSFDPPTEASADATDSYLSDPAKPVPYTSEVRTTRGVEYMVEDQRFAARRPDVLVYQSETLDRDLTLAGPVTADLHVAATGTDADFVVKLIDVFPEDHPDLKKEEKHLNVPMGGYQMLVRGDVMRAKFRNSYAHPEPLEPGKVTSVRFELPDVGHCFKTGHRIMVQIQSSWFPLVDRNPQTFVDIYKAADDDFQAATHRVFRSAKHPSRLQVAVLAE
jgi:putative CocE/NonD family hydrolase